MCGSSRQFLRGQWQLIIYWRAVSKCWACGLCFKQLYLKAWTCCNDLPWNMTLTFSYQSQPGSYWTKMPQFKTIYDKASVWIHMLKIIIFIQIFSVFTNILTTPTVTGDVHTPTGYILQTSALHGSSIVTISSPSHTHLIYMQQVCVEK